MVKKKVTLSIDSKVYKDFQRACEDIDMLVSKRVERLMKEETEVLKKLLEVLKPKK